MFFSILSVLALGQHVAATPVPKDASGLPLPYRIEEERFTKGDYLAPYTFLKSHEAEYRASKMWSDAYTQALATYESFVGLTDEARREYGRRLHPSSTAPLAANPFEGYAAKDAVDFLLNRAEKERILMIGEVHHAPQTRVLGIRLLKGLWARGYRYFAAEAFSTPSAPTNDPKLNDRKYPIHDTGFYTQDPVFGELVRRAARIGFKLVPYEAEGLESAKPEERAQAREDREAANLKKIFDADPKAKVFVWNGYSHNSELDDIKATGEALMGLRFKQMTGIDPYTVNLSLSWESAGPEFQTAEYRYAADHGLLTHETVFVKDGKAFSFFPDSNDCNVFLPPTKLQDGRPDWLGRELHRYPFPLPQEMVKGEGRHLAQVFCAGEPATAIPVDQIVLEAGQKTATMMVPPAAVWLRVLDEKGRSSRIMRFKMNALDRDGDEEEVIADRELANELARRVKIDQDARARGIEEGKKSPKSSESVKAAWDAIGRIDEENTAWLKNVVDEKGWPTRSMVGATGSHNAWLLVQHADRDSKFQRRCLDLMKPLMAKNEISKLDFAYLTDRVLLAEGKKQVYGTQMTTKDGKWAPLPVEDPKHLDRRRKEVGLEPMAEYIKIIEKTYGAPKG